ncbi:hypothetical protein HMPREF1338_01799 [Enterococcus faecalis ERV68]|nr:hypothetical protein HMPREF1331_01802 [Enterococcus faecalis ERV25]EJV18329.1 hypothetical protein HMPREF1338_01799 [Enterococcus faecalis ERV68]
MKCKYKIVLGNHVSTRLFYETLLLFPIGVFYRKESYYDDSFILKQPIF